MPFDSSPTWTRTLADGRILSIIGTPEKADEIPQKSPKERRRGGNPIAKADLQIATHKSHNSHNKMYRVGPLPQNWTHDVPLSFSDSNELQAMAKDFKKLDTISNSSGEGKNLPPSFVVVFPDRVASF